MKHVSIIIPLGHASISHIESTFQILSHVNGILTKQHHSSLFNIQLVGLNIPKNNIGSRFAAQPDVLINDVKHTELIIIPAMIGNPKDFIALNQDFIPWIQQQYDNGAEVASFCIGAFFLAATGLLKGKQCSTHWFSAVAFRQMFPDVNLLDDKIMTDDDGIYTSGGAYSYLNLILYLIEKFASRDIAILIAKTYMVDIDRTCQSPFMIFQGQKEHKDEQIKRAQLFIEENLAEKISIDDIAGMLLLSRRSLERRFKEATQNTIIEYVQRVKIEAAKKKFESSNKTISEVMYDVGYNDSKGFRNIFKKVTGLSPGEYRRKYNKVFSKE